MSRLVPPLGGSDVDGTVENIREFNRRNLNDWNFAEHFEPDVFTQVSCRTRARVRKYRSMGIEVNRCCSCPRYIADH